MSWHEEICTSCGICCTTLSIVRITADDIERLIKGYNVTREQALAMVRTHQGEFRILMDKTAACPALNAQGGRYVCQAYEHRPGICREYECYILASAKDWLKKREENEKIAETNPFHSASGEQELARQVQDSIRTLRANFLRLCLEHPQESARKFDHIPQLVRVLSGEAFESAFPPRSIQPGS